MVTGRRTYWQGIEPSTFAAYLDELGRWYNGADVIAERNNHGHLLIRELQRLGNLRVLEGYDCKPGWLSNIKGKPLLYGLVGLRCVMQSAQSMAARRRRSWPALRRQRCTPRRAARQPCRCICAGHCGTRMEAGDPAQHDDRAGGPVGCLRQEQLVRRRPITPIERFAAWLAAVTLVPPGKTSDGFEPFTRPQGIVDRGWGELSQEMDDAREAWRHNPLARRLVGMVTAFMWSGTALPCAVNTPRCSALLTTSGTATRSGSAHSQWCDELCRAGNLACSLRQSTDRTSTVRCVPASIVEWDSA